MTSFALPVSFSQGQVWLTYPQQQDSSGSEERQLPVTAGTKQETVGSMDLGWGHRGHCSLLQLCPHALFPPWYKLYPFITPVQMGNTGPEIRMFRA